MCFDIKELNWGILPLGKEVRERDHGEAWSTCSTLPRSQLRETLPNTWEMERSLDSKVFVLNGVVNSVGE